MLPANCLAAFAFASHGLLASFHLLMPLFSCCSVAGAGIAGNAQEAQTLAWVRPEKLADSSDAGCTRIGPLGAAASGDFSVI